MLLYYGISVLRMISLTQLSEIILGLNEYLCPIVTLYTATVFFV